MLQLELKTTSPIPVEVEGITPDALRSLALAEIERLPIFHGNEWLPLGELFRIRGDAADESIAWSGDLRGVHWLGAKMKSGRMHVTGSCGRHVGSEMRGGEIHVQGSVSDWAGAEMHGGLLHVRGDAGDLLGAAHRGSPKGMTRGTILVHGSAGHEIGSGMRRGLIAIGGDCGDLVGFHMLAGTILCFGRTGRRHGAGMKRGTLGFFGAVPQLLPTFRHACRYAPDALRLVERELIRLDFPVCPGQLTSSCDLYNGDFLTGGRGEILIRTL